MARGGNVTVPLDHYHPEIAQATGPLPHEAGCGQLISSVPQIVFTNFAVASAMANAFFAVACDALTYQEVKLDILDARCCPSSPWLAAPVHRRAMRPWSDCRD